MKSNEVVLNDQRAFCYLGQIPQKMLKFHHTDHMTEYVLYDLCHEQCFNLNKAAYFVDNPDFNCLKGVAGYSRSEIKSLPSTTWQNPDLFSKAFNSSAFNRQVRDMMQCSVKKGNIADKENARELAKKLGMNEAHYCSWDMKHDNHGLLLYEPTDQKEQPSQECILSGVCLLSFCPIY